MAVTLADLTAEVELFLYSYFADRDKVTTLTADITALTTQLPVEEPDLVDRGFVEIDHELIAIKSKDSQNQRINAFAWGRGARGTAATVHNADSMVTVNPRFPKSWMKTEINEAIANLYPDLFGVGSTSDLTVVPLKVTYELPAEAEGILSIHAADIGPSGLWIPVLRYRFNGQADASKYATTKTVDIIDPMPPGAKIKVVYRKKFGSLADPGSALESIGVDPTWRDLIKLQVCAKMILALDSSRLQQSSVEASQRAQLVNTGAAASISRQLLTMYAQRLQQERLNLLTTYPASQVRHS